VALDCQGGGAMADGGVRRAESEGLNEREREREEEKRAHVVSKSSYVHRLPRYQRT
jgi:hypothetical protein